MISEWIKKEIVEAIENPSHYNSRSGRKELQATYELMLGEISQSIFHEQMESRMGLRQKLNSMHPKSHIVRAILTMMRDEHCLFSKDYRDHSQDIDKFLRNHLNHFIKAVNENGQ